MAKQHGQIEKIQQKNSKNSMDSENMPCMPGFKKLDKTNIMLKYWYVNNKSTKELLTWLDWATSWLDWGS